MKKTKKKHLIKQHSCKHKYDWQKKGHPKCLKCNHLASKIEIAFYDGYREDYIKAYKKCNGSTPTVEYSNGRIIINGDRQLFFNKELIMIKYHIWKSFKKDTFDLDVKKYHARKKNMITIVLFHKVSITLPFRDFKVPNHMKRHNKLLS